MKMNQKFVSGIKGGEGSAKQKNKKIKHKKNLGAQKKKSRTSLLLPLIGYLN